MSRDKRDEVDIDDNFDMVDVAMAMRRLTSLQLLLFNLRRLKANTKVIFVNDEPLKATDYFTYLGSTLSREANIDVYIATLIELRSASGRYSNKLMCCFQLSFA